MRAAYLGRDGVGFSWLLGPFPLRALFGSLALVRLVLFREVAAVAVRLEPENRRLRRRGVGFGPCLRFGIANGEVGTEFFETRLFR